MRSASIGIVRIRRLSAGFFSRNNRFSRLLLVRPASVLEVSGEALFVRKPTPGIDPMAAFEPQREKVVEGLHAVRDLTGWLEDKAGSLLKILQ